MGIALVIAAIILYFYSQGSVENYKPPKTNAEPPKTQVMNDLMALSRAIDAYYSMNLQYPDSLSQLQPDFLSQIPSEPVTGKMYSYQTNKTSQYTITVSDPSIYELKELHVENGKIIQQ